MRSTRIPVLAMSAMIMMLMPFQSCAKPALPEDNDGPVKPVEPQPEEVTVPVWAEGLLTDVYPEVASGDGTFGSNYAMGEEIKSAGPAAALAPVSGKPEKTFRNFYGNQVGIYAGGQRRLLRERMWSKVTDVPINEAYKACPELLAETKIQLKVMNKDDFDIRKHPFKDVVYKTVDGGQLKIQYVLPKTGRPAPFIVLIHGGGWHSGDGYGYATKGLLSYYASKGYAAFTVQYRLMDRPISTPGPQGVCHSCYDQLEDIRDAVNFIKNHAKEWNINPERYAYTGGSAGGHLTILSALNDPDCSCSAPNFPVSDIKQFYVFISEDPVKNTCDKFFHFNDLAKYAELNPVDAALKHHIKAPMLVLHGTHDLTADFRDTKKFVVNMRKNGNYCDFIAYRNIDHSFESVGYGGPATGVSEDAQLRMLSFFDKYLK